jgi:aspartokinase-like uncharacterized kinase
MRSAETGSSIVVKVGGSLYDLPDLGSRLRRWLAAQGTDSMLMVPGGGALAEAVRELDSTHGLGAEIAHWLALRALTVNAHFLATLLPGALVVGHPEEWKRDTTAVLDSHAFAVADEGRAGALPHSWAVTSDSIAARVACVSGVRRLILLKSVVIPHDVDWREAARRGWVDEYFPLLVDGTLEVQPVNFKSR